MLRLLLIGTILSLSAQAQAQGVYKCTAGGRVSYSDQPCPGGTELPVDSAAVAESEHAARRAAAEKKLLHRIEVERDREEAQSLRAQRRAAKQRKANEKKCAGLARREKWARENAAKAAGRAASKARLRAERMTEQYEQECSPRTPGPLSIAG